MIEVAIVRPGPIQGDMVHPYLRRREGREPVTYPTEALKRVLEKTLGVPLFQEQAMQIAIVAAGFAPSEADQLRRAMGTFKFTDGVKHFHDKLVDGMIANGYPPAFAERTFKQVSLSSQLAAAWIAQGDLAARRSDDRAAAQLYRRAAETLQDFRF